MTPPPKVLAGWLGTRDAVPGTPVLAPVRWLGVPGSLYVAGPGRHALSVEGSPTAFDAGPGTAQPFGALWLALDLWTASGAEELSATLASAGVDLGRGGYARSRWTEGGIAVTVGARGEGEGGLPQVWFGRRSRWPCRVVVPGGPPVTVGPRGPAGWPAWILVGEDRLLEFTAPPTPARDVPEWARRAAGAAGERFPENWRRAFGGSEP